MGEGDGRQHKNPELVGGHPLGVGHQADKEPSLPGLHKRLCLLWPLALNAALGQSRRGLEPPSSASPNQRNRQGHAQAFGVL